jgi:hypothetical protein
MNQKITFLTKYHLSKFIYIPFHTMNRGTITREPPPGYKPTTKDIMNRRNHQQ